MKVQIQRMTTSNKAITPDDRHFREVFGHFATGVTIVTSMDQGTPVGLAANSFTSLSLDPPLVLFCIANSSTTWPRIEASKKFAVNVLGEDHQDLCRLFAQRGADRFEHAGWHQGVSGSPVLDDAIAYIDCEIEAQYPGGDHQIVVGRVIDLDMSQDARPLIFFKGSYGVVGRNDG
jgi:3-hydroxy-9,10-secoandrosta-1,3,5(10)-triene-9,17-dione monooxygenase reductase component